MILREETFEQTDGLGLLELRGESEDETVLFLNGEPLVYDASDSVGSVARFTVLLPTEQRLVAQVQVEMGAEHGFLDAKPLYEQVSPLLHLMPNGSYRLSLEDLHHYEILEWTPVGQFESGWVMTYYPEFREKDTEPFITTQPDKHLDRERVDFYISEIERGMRPALIALSAEDSVYTRFIIDGHHKLKAYIATDVKPRILRIQLHRHTLVPASQARDILANVEGINVVDYLHTKEWMEARYPPEQRSNNQSS